MFAIFTAYWFSLTSKLNLPISNIEIASVFVLRALNNITKTLQRLKMTGFFLIAVMLLQVPALAVIFQYSPTQNLTGKLVFFVCLFHFDVLTKILRHQISLKQMQ